MARRREPVRQAAGRPEAPLWIRQLNRGMRHLGSVDSAGSIVLADWALQRWRMAQADWCRDTACWRAGKSCEEAGMRPCPDRRAGGG